MTVPADLRWAGLLLAAGQSIRMGQPKSRLSWQGRPLLLHQIEALLDAGADPVVVVLRPADACLLTENAPDRSEAKVIP
ncbi:MAG: NTP transferase domain-containing protein, partial [Candidatus Eisenbacteria bacterium]|nr:NTP transferase domain-containing protein [Candidatus Eisenbacteria bacterium]